MKQKAILFILITLFTTIFCFGIQQKHNPVEPTHADTAAICADSLLAGFKQDGPGGAVAVIDNNKIIFTGTYGLANLEWNIPNDTNVCYRIASLTKTFTALAVLQLAENGKLGLQDKIQNWFPELETDPGITVAHVLSHTSGIQPGTAITEFVPGEKMNYSNYGYQLLGKLVAKASGVSYDQYLQEQIFRPLEMYHSGYDHNLNILPRRASGYQMSDGMPLNIMDTDMEGAGGAGGLYSTVNDLALFAKALNGNGVLPESVVDAAFHPFKLNNGEPGPYGFGWMIDNYRGWQQVGHGGDIDGFNCFFAHFPEKNRTVIVLQNCKMQMNADEFNGSRLAHRLVDLFWENELAPDQSDLKEIFVPEEKLQLLAGTYFFENAPDEMITAMGPTLEITVENGKLVARDKNGTAPLVAVSEKEFAVKGIDIKVKFIPGETEKPEGLNLLIMNVRDLFARRSD